MLKLCCYADTAAQEQLCSVEMGQEVTRMKVTQSLWFKELDKTAKELSQLFTTLGFLAME